MLLGYPVAHPFGRGVAAHVERIFLSGKRHLARRQGVMPRHIGCTQVRLPDRGLLLEALKKKERVGGQPVRDEPAGESEVLLRKGEAHRDHELAKIGHPPCRPEKRRPFACAQVQECHDVRMVALG
mgnify:CR=1 FL=1